MANTILMKTKDGHRFFQINLSRGYGKASVQNTLVLARRLEKTDSSAGGREAAQTGCGL